MAGAVWLACVGGLSLGATWALTGGREAVPGVRGRGPLGLVGLWRIRCQELLGRLGARIRPVATAWAPWATVADALRRQHWAAGLCASADQGFGMLACLGAGSCVAGTVLAGGPAGAVVGLGLFAGALPVVAGRLEQRRREAAVRSLPDTYRSLGSALATGRTLVQAMEHVGAHGSGEVAEAFQAAALELHCGSRLDEALELLGRRLPAGTSGLLVAALTVSQRTGAPLHRLLDQAAGLLERREELERLLRTKTAQARLSAQVVMALPAVLGALLALLSPDYRAGLTTPAGLASLGVAAALDLAAVWAMRRVMSRARP